MTFSSGLSKLSFSGVKELSLPNVFCFYHASYFYQRKYIIKNLRIREFLANMELTRLTGIGRLKPPFAPESLLEILSIKQHMSVDSSIAMLPVTLINSSQQE